MDTRLYRWFSNQVNYRRRHWYHHPVSRWCNTDCQFCHREESNVPTIVQKQRHLCRQHRQEKDAYHLIDRPGQVVFARLRSGHNRLNTHMHRKLKIVPSPTCPCGEEDQTTEHVLQRCNRHESERIAQWPSTTPLHQKLYGAWRTWRRPPTSSLLLDWSCRRTRRRRRIHHIMQFSRRHYNEVIYDT